MTDFAEAIAALREKKPLIHCITNYVTAGDTANMLLAAGASPIMADDPAETAEISACADALVLNMGTLSESRISAMLKAGEAANKKGIPIVLDPVGVHLSEFRRTAARRLLSELKISVIRGNLSELLFMGGIPVESHGVDSAEEQTEGLKLSAAADVALRYDCVCAVTGAEDIITDGSAAARLLNGCTALKKITGAGCMTTALTAAFSAVCEPFSAAVFGTAFMGICGELSEYTPPCRYMGSFRSNLFDNAGRDGTEFAERIKIEE
ncbi:MAG: hydroxyethylthiazole kinase [Ruminococcaceae bacterium]|nr:hydroxyethylthiazole kinase [Oscillospiraceae bacterium]